MSAPILWAQRKDALYVTVNVPDLDKDTVKIELTGDRLTFR